MIKKFDFHTDKVKILSSSKLIKRYYMKKLFFLSAVMAMVSTSFSMQYYAGKYRPDDDSGYDLKWSTCVWGNNVNFETLPLPGKPGANDYVSVRPGARFNFEIDGNYTVHTFGSADSARTYAKGRNLKFRKMFRASLATSNSQTTRSEWEKCNIECGGPLEISYWQEARQAGKLLFVFDDTKLTLKGDLNCTIPANPEIVKNENRAGIDFTVVGASNILFNGGANVDSIIVDKNDEWMFKWTFKEKAGKLPYVFFNRRAEFEKCDIELVVSDKVKVGVYGLLEFQDRKSGIKNPRSVVINGETYKLGDEFKIGKLKGKLSLGAFGKRDKKTENDLILTISK